MQTNLSSKQTVYYDLQNKTFEVPSNLSSWVKDLIERNNYFQTYLQESLPQKTTQWIQLDRTNLLGDSLERKADESVLLYLESSHKKEGILSFSLDKKEQALAKLRQKKIDFAFIPKLPEFSIDTDRFIIEYKGMSFKLSQEAIQGALKMRGEDHYISSDLYCRLLEKHRNALQKHLKKKPREFKQFDFYLCLNPGNGERILNTVIFYEPKQQKTEAPHYFTILTSYFCAQNVLKARLKEKGICMGLEPWKRTLPTATFL